MAVLRQEHSSQAACEGFAFTQLQHQHALEWADAAHFSKLPCAHTPRKEGSLTPDSAVGFVQPEATQL